MSKNTGLNKWGRVIGTDDDGWRLVAFSDLSGAWLELTRFEGLPEGEMISVCIQHKYTHQHPEFGPLGFMVGITLYEGTKRETEIWSAPVATIHEAKEMAFDMLAALIAQWLEGKGLKPEEVLP